MSKTYMDLPTRLEVDFQNIDNDIVMDLRHNNTEFQAIDRQIIEIQEKYPIVVRVLENPGEVHLTAEEHDILLEYLRVALERDNMERQHIYFRGHTDALAYLKKMKAI